MATSGVQGFRAKLRVSSDGVTYINLAELTSISPSRRAGVIRASHHDDESFVAKMAGKIDASLNGGCNYVPGDPGQDLVDTVQRTPGAYLYFKWLAHNTVGAPMLTGRGIVTDFSLTASDESAQSRSLTIDVDGALTNAFAAAGDVM